MLVANANASIDVKPMAKTDAKTVLHTFTLRLLRYHHKYRSDPSVFCCICSVSEVASVFEAAAQKNDIGTEAKTEGL